MRSYQDYGSENASPEYIKESVGFLLSVRPTDAERAKFTKWIDHHKGWVSPPVEGFLEQINL